jgi:hypothetical protein
LGPFHNEIFFDIVQSKYIRRRRSGIYRAEKRRGIAMAAICRNIEGHYFEDKIRYTEINLLFIENNNNPYEIHNNCIKLSTVFLSIIIYSAGSKNI